MSRKRPVPDASGEGRAIFGSAGLLLLAAFLAYGNSFHVPFFFDDADAITNNPTIRDLSDFGRVLSPPANGSGATGRPMVNLSLAVNFAFGGTEPFGYHVLNLVLHALATLALFGLVRRTLLLPILQPRFGRAATGLALATALLWTVHPLLTESVTCVIQRTEVLVAVFYLTTLYCFVRAATERVRWGWGLAAGGACLLGMASKEVMVSAPVIALLFDRTFLAGSFREAWKARRPLYLGLASTWVLLGALLIGMGGSRGTAAGFGLGVTPWNYALTQCEAIILYLRLALWPHPLLVDYGVDVVTNPLDVVPQAAVLIPLVVGTFAALRWRPLVGFAAFWFFSLLAPSSSVIPLITQTIAEHRMYLPLAPLLAMAVLGLHVVAGSRRSRMTVAMVVAAAVALGLTTHARNRVYQDPFTLWSDAIAKRPKNPRAYDNLALAHYQAGRPAEAVRYYEKAAALNPHSATSQVMLGTSCLQAGDLDRARGHLEAALRLDPGHASARNNLGIVHFRQGRFDAAIEEYRRALTATPDNTEVLRNLGSAYASQGDLASALRSFERVLRLQPENTGARNGLAYALMAAGRLEEAIRHYQESLRQVPRQYEAHTNLASALLRSERFAEAAVQARVALQIDPSAAEAHNNLGVALFRLGRTAESIAQLEEALRLKPDYPDARDNLQKIRAVAERAVPTPPGSTR